MWKSLWIGIAFALIAVSAEPAIDNEEIVGDTVEDAVVGEENNNNYDDDYKNIDGNIPGFDFDKGLPSPDELLAMLESMNLSDEEKANLHDAIMNNANLDSVVERSQTSGKPFMYQIFMLLGLLSIVAVIFVFFGYKLYKSLIEKERRREMKRKQKELKKKK
ncbi:uncharacterized protein LOC130663898 [Microplitis mediator]|uniref:uncharacterized protein LOC130663898 n=1 Tax=Microplitis mediator TaxID=375433 RepID=UPI002553CAF8|nr:uncharacterized protein LOC130663898 [Microplitis mediator]XP_057319437.1 uncharacterized protein LOC130663898 [Microplitis mediator]